MFRRSLKFNASHLGVESCGPHGQPELPMARFSSPCDSFREGVWFISPLDPHYSRRPRGRRGPLPSRRVAQPRRAGVETARRGELGVWRRCHSPGRTLHTSYAAVNLNPTRIFRVERGL